MPTIKTLIDTIPISQLINTDDSPFWYLPTYTGHVADGKHRYKHEQGKPGDTFRDGNNGDLWKVIAINTENKRIYISNMTQRGWSQIIYWD